MLRGCREQRGDGTDRDLTDAPRLMFVGAPPPHPDVESRPRRPLVICLGVGVGGPASHRGLVDVRSARVVEGVPGSRFWSSVALQTAQKVFDFWVHFGVHFGCPDACWCVFSEPVLELYLYVNGSEGVRFLGAFGAFWSFIYM